MSSDNKQTVSFYDESERYLITTKPGFITENYFLTFQEANCRPNAHKVPYSTYELNKSFNMISYLHNPFGPAILDCKTGNEEWFIDGKPVSKLQIETTKNINNFNEKIKGILDD